MAGRRPRNPPKAWDTPEGPKDPFASMYHGILDHDAYKNMSDKARLLYVYCRRNSHGQASRDYAKGRFGDWRYGSDPDRLFYMNFSQAKVHGLYNDGNKAGLRRDMEELILHGFVDCVIHGGGNNRKALYALSNRYAKWPDVETPSDCKTRHMRNRDARDRGRESSPTEGENCHPTQGRESSPAKEKTKVDNSHPHEVTNITPVKVTQGDKGEDCHPPKPQNPSSPENPEGENSHPERISSPCVAPEAYVSGPSQSEENDRDLKREKQADFFAGVDGGSCGECDPFSPPYSPIPAPLTSEGQDRYGWEDFTGYMDSYAEGEPDAIMSLDEWADKNVPY